MRHRGFTLVELLVVIAIIAALAGMATVGMTIASKAKAKTKTQSLMANLQADLTSFKTVHGWYPEEDTTPPLPTATAKWADVYGPVTSPVAATALVSDADNNPSMPWDNRSGVADKAAKYLIYQLNQMGGSYKDLKDAWGITMRYRPAKYYPFSATATATATGIDSENPPAKDSYQLWSCGLDKTDQQGLGDDLTSWPK